jgi:hypothetical protein
MRGTLFLTGLAIVFAFCGNVIDAQGYGQYIQNGSYYSYN